MDPAFSAGAMTKLLRYLYTGSVAGAAATRGSCSRCGRRRQRQ